MGITVSREAGAMHAGISGGTLEIGVSMVVRVKAQLRGVFKASVKVSSKYLSKQYY